MSVQFSKMPLFTEHVAVCEVARERKRIKLKEKEILNERLHLEVFNTFSTLHQKKFCS